MTGALSAACRRILERGDLPSKLHPLPLDAERRDSVDASDAFAPDPSSPPCPVAPTRDTGLRFSTAGSESLPRPNALTDPGARARCIARFAHHELMAVELFAWALLRWPMLPSGLRRDWARVLREEQIHCELYLERLAAHGEALDAFPSSDYFWRHCGRAANPAAFLAAMGLTLEQANLDFSLRYAEAFRRAGDDATAKVLERIHLDEVRHVETALRWLRALDADAPDDIARYEAAIEFPLSAARAKGRPFRADARRRAGLEASFIEYVRRARSTQERSGGNP